MSPSYEDELPPASSESGEDGFARSGEARFSDLVHESSGGVMVVQPHPQATRHIVEANAGVRLRLPFAIVTP